MTERGQLISDRPVVAELASCMQTRLRRGLFPFPWSHAQPSALCCFVWLRGQHRQQYLTRSAPVTATVWANSVPHRVINITQGKYVFPCFHLPRYASEQGRDSPKVRKTVIYNVGGRWNRGDCGTKGAKYFKHLLEACARCRIPDKMCHLSVLEWNFLCP